MIYLSDSYLETVCKFSNVRLVEEIRGLESIIDSDLVGGVMFYDDIMHCYDVLRDECVNRLGYAAKFRVVKN